MAARMTQREKASLRAEAEHLATVLQHGVGRGVSARGRMIRAALDAADFAAVQAVMEWWNGHSETSRRDTLAHCTYRMLRNAGWDDDTAYHEAFAVRRRRKNYLAADEKARLKAVKQRVRRERAATR